MIFKRTLLKKVLSTGELAEFMLVKDAEGFRAALSVNGSQIPGTPLPFPLDWPKGEITHWMGNKRVSVGLTTKEAEMIIEAVEVENDSLLYREQLGAR
ncbi:MAG TPA: hypothetical protein VF799_02565 [Geobacteraceae bacterium]